jgi:putative membrane protein
MNSAADRRFFIVNALVSASALGFLGWLLVVRQVAPTTGLDISWMPALNATLNTISAILLLVGWRFIRANNRQAHRTAMITAMASSGLFLVSYVIYHSLHGDTKFTGTGLLRPFYFSILISHIILSAVIVPGALAAFWFALRSEFERHKKVTRILLPIWLYVSVTGVLIFWLLRSYSAATVAAS